MSNILKNPHYCPEDKDVLDLLKSASISTEELVSFLRKRGVYVSKDASKEDLIYHISSEIYTWEDVTELLGLVALPIKKEHFVVATHKSDAEFELLEEAVAKVRQHRLQKYGDHVHITPAGDGKYRVHIEYTEVFYEKTRLIQSVEQDAEIILEKTANGFTTRRTSDQTARDVELAILGEFEKAAQEKQKTLESSKILLSQLKTVKSKVRFFTDLMEGVSGYSFGEIKSVRVQSVKNAKVVLDTDENDDIAKAYASEIESLIINGRNVGGTNLYDEYVGKDFFPLAATWIVNSDTDECRRVEIRAGFSPSASDCELQFSVSGVWYYRDDSLQPKSRPNAIVTGRFGELLRQSAEAAMATAEKITD